MRSPRTSRGLESYGRRTPPIGRVVLFSGHLAGEQTPNRKGDGPCLAYPSSRIGSTRPENDDDREAGEDGGLRAGAPGDLRPDAPREGGEVRRDLPAREGDDPEAL